MLGVLGGCVVILALIGLGFYAVGKMGPDSFRVRTTLLRIFSFSMEIGSSGKVRVSPHTDAEVTDPDVGPPELRH
jgi:hypothetical protein